jgi:hypothetical protein
MDTFSIYSANVRQERGSWPVVVSWWAGAGYKDHADRLLSSLRTYWIEHLVLRSEYDPRGWEYNCSRKPSVILRAMNLIPYRPLLWLDADAEIVRTPSWMESPEGILMDTAADIACLRPEPGVTWPRVNSALLSGTLGFNPKDGSRKIVARWEVACRLDPSALDQDTLLGVLNGTAHVSWGLDPRYVCIPDLMPDVEDPYIVHHQASRKAECRFSSP